MILLTKRGFINRGMMGWTDGCRKHLELGQLIQHPSRASRFAAATSWRPPSSVLAAVPEDTFDIDILFHISSLNDSSNRATTTPKRSSKELMLMSPGLPVG